jgi:hypothetical protein
LGFPDQVGKRYIVDHFADRIVNLLPDIQRYACFASRALIRFVFHTGDGHQASLDQPKDHSYGILFGKER